MDLEEFRSFVLDSGVDVWTWIDMAISMASADHETELKNRRDGIIQKLYAPTVAKCHNCDHQLDKTEENRKNDVGRDYSTEMLQERKMAVGDEVDEEEERDEQWKVDEIKILLDDQSQDESCLIGLLQRLVDMNITFKVLKETDIGRHVTQFRKHSSNEVRRLVKILVRKWKDTVDEWVRMSSPMGEVAPFSGDRESTHGDTNSTYYLTPHKGKVIDKHIESDNYSATKHVQSDHQEDQNAKRQRTGQALNFQHVPKATNPLVTSSRGRVPVKY